MKHRIHACGLPDVSATAKTIGASHLVSAIEAHYFPKTPKGISRDRHLMLDMDDIAEFHPDRTAPSEQHVLELLGFVSDWDQSAPMLVHCYAGMSRSTACAFIALCALNPKDNEGRIAKAIGRLSPTATPNRRLVALADDIMQRNGRMIAAVSEMYAPFIDIAAPFGIGLSDFMEAA